MRFSRNVLSSAQKSASSARQKGMCSFLRAPLHPGPQCRSLATGRQLSAGAPSSSLFHALSSLLSSSSSSSPSRPSTSSPSSPRHWSLPARFLQPTTADVALFAPAGSRLRDRDPQGRVFFATLLCYDLGRGPLKARSGPAKTGNLRREVRASGRIRGRARELHSSLAKGPRAAGEVDGAFWRGLKTSRLSGHPLGGSFIFGLARAQPMAQPKATILFSAWRGRLVAQPIGGNYLFRAGDGETHGKTNWRQCHVRHTPRARCGPIGSSIQRPCGGHASFQRPFRHTPHTFRGHIWISTEGPRGGGHVRPPQPSQHTLPRFVARRELHRRPQWRWPHASPPFMSAHISHA